MFSMCKIDWENNTLFDNDHPLANSQYLKYARKLTDMFEKI